MLMVDSSLASLIGDRMPPRWPDAVASIPGGVKTRDMHFAPWPFWLLRYCAIAEVEVEEAYCSRAR